MRLEADAHDIDRAGRPDPHRARGRAHQHCGRLRGGDPAGVVQERVRQVEDDLDASIGKDALRRARVARDPPRSIQKQRIQRERRGRVGVSKYSISLTDSYNTGGTRVNRFRT